MNYGRINVLSGANIKAPDDPIGRFAKEYTEGKHKHRPGKPSGYPEKIKKKDERGSEIEVLLKPGSKDWVLNQARWLFWNYCNNYTDINFSKRSEMISERLYASGRQPIGKYLNQWFKQRKTDTRAKTFANISFDIAAVMPKLQNYVIGAFDKVDFGVKVTCVDESAASEREMELWRQAEMIEQQWKFDGVSQMTGIPKEEPSIPFSPKNNDEVQMMMDMGFVKLPSEAKLEKELKEARQESNWVQEIKPKLHKDLFRHGWAATKVYTDPVSKRPMVRYVDPVNAIVKFRQSDMTARDISYAGEIKPYTLGDLRAAGIKGEELNNAIKQYRQLFTSSVEYNSIDISTEVAYNNSYSSFLVWVLDFEYESIDFERHEWVEFGGEQIPRSIQWNKKLDPSAKESMTEYPKWRRAKWVIGTDIVFDHGEQFDIPYNQFDRPESLFTFYRASDRSTVSLTIPDADSFQLMVLKHRAAVAMLRPHGVLLDKNSFKDLMIAGNKFDWIDQMDAFFQTGRGIIQNPTTPLGQAMPGVPPAVQEVKGTVEYLRHYRIEMQDILNEMSLKTGISAPITGEQPNPSTPVRTTEIALQGTNEVLRPQLMGYRWLLEKSMSKLARVFEIREMNQLLDDYPNIVGSENVNIAQFASRFHHGVYVTTLIDDTMREKIAEAAQRSLDAAKTGEPGIELSDFLAIMNLLSEGLIQSARLMLISRENQRKQELMQKEQQMQAMNQQNAAQQQQLKNEGKMAEIQGKAQAGAQAQISVDNNKMLHELYNTMMELKAKFEAEKEMAHIEGREDRQTARAQPKPEPSSA